MFNAQLGGWAVQRLLASSLRGVTDTGQFQAPSVKSLNSGLGRDPYTGSPATGSIPITYSQDSENLELLGAILLISGYLTQDIGEAGFRTPRTLGPKALKTGLGINDI